MSKDRLRRADNRRMTGNVNIYICSEDANNNKKKNVADGSTRSESSLSEAFATDKKSRQHRVTSNDNSREMRYNNGYSASFNLKTPQQEKLISSRRFNDSASSHDFDKPARKGVDPANVVSCRCPRFDESDQWLSRFAKKRDDPGVESFSVDKKNAAALEDDVKSKKTAVLQEIKQRRNRPVDEDKKMEKDRQGCTCDRSKDSRDKACDPLCTCCCAQSSAREKSVKTGDARAAKEDKKSKSRGVKSSGEVVVDGGKVDKRKKKVKDERQAEETSKNEKKKEETKVKDAKDKSKEKKKEKKSVDKAKPDDNKEVSFFGRLFGVFRSKKADQKKSGRCSPDCTGLLEEKSANDRLKGGGEKDKRRSRRRGRRDSDKTRDNTAVDSKKKKKKGKDKPRKREDRCTCCPLEMLKRPHPSALCLKCLYPTRSCACDAKIAKLSSKIMDDRQLAYQRSKVFPRVLSEFKRRIA